MVSQACRVPTANDGAWKQRRRWRSTTRRFVGGGPGGQHRNKTASAVRIVHLPTGVTVTATERRSQLRNRGAALERLRAVLTGLARVRRPRRPTVPSRASKERRIEAKKRTGRRKAERRDRGGW